MNNAVQLPFDLPELSIASEGGLVRRTILPSGLRILTERVAGARSATVGFWVPVGSRDEEDFVAQPGGPSISRRGSTHFLEHLLFKGTTRRTAMDIAVAFDQVGGEHNAVTGKEHTCYYAKIRDQDLHMAVDVLADMVTSATLDPEEFETERGVILEELAMANDDTADAAGDRLFEAVLGEHPLARPVGGTPQSIESVSRDAVYDHYRVHYEPADLIVAVAGAVDHDDLVAHVVAKLTEYGWDLQTPAAPRVRRSTCPATIVRATDRIVLERPTEQTSVMVGMPGIVATDPRRYELAVLNGILGGGMSSRLFQEIRERRGLVYSVYSFASNYSDAGLFGMYAGCSPERATDVTELMIAELERIASAGVTDSELARVLGQLSGSATLSLEDSDARMSRLGRSEIVTGEFVDLDENQRRLERVTRATIQELATHLAGAPRSVCLVGGVTEAAVA